MSDLITYEDKIRLKSQNVSDKYKVTAEDMNEIKRVVNNNATEGVSVGAEEPTDGRRVWFSKSKNLIKGWQQGFWGTTDGSYNGTRTDYICTYKIPVKPNNEYTYKHGIGETTIYVLQYGENDNYLSYEKFDNSYQVQITTSANTYFIGIDITKEGIAISPSDMREGQLNEGTTAAPYEPYIEPSIKVDDEDFISMSNLVSVGRNKPSDGKRVWFAHSKNVLQHSAYDRTLNGVTLKVNDDKSITLTGTASANTNFNIGTNATLQLKAGTYTFTKGATNVQLLIYYSSASVLGNLPIGTSSQTITINSDTTYENYRVVISIPSGTQINETIYPMLRLSTTSNAYEPYVEQGIYIDEEEWFRKNQLEDVTSNVSVSFEGGSISAGDIGSLTAQKFYHIAPHIYIGNIVLTNVTPHYNNDQMQILFKVSGIGTILKCVGSGGNYDRQFASIFDDVNNNIYAYIQKGATATATATFNATYRCIFITQGD